MRFLYLIGTVFLFPDYLPAQRDRSLPDSVSFAHFDDFEPVSANWKLGSKVLYDSLTGNLEPVPGPGVAVNLPGEGHNGDLFTKLQHGDIELEFEFMMAKKSNSGVYLQGRYEVQMFDSWGKEIPEFYDCGGIYQRWDEKREAGKKGYEGKAPAFNACRKPGTWQHFRIVFHAPRFDQNGRKKENARFGEVVLNGVLIHENVEVTGPTRSAAFEDEKPFGPIMFQGDHGPVAIRNVRYRTGMKK